MDSSAAGTGDRSSKIAARRVIDLSSAHFKATSMKRGMMPHLQINWQKILGPYGQVLRHAAGLAPPGFARSAWRTLTKKAGLPGFRFHDLRHCAITQLAENGAADSTIMAIAGHVSRRMLERYSHVRMEAKRTALEALAVSTKTAGYDTNHDTNASPVSTRPV